MADEADNQGQQQRDESSLQLLNEICDTLGLSMNVRRVIIDIDIRDAPRLYIEEVGSERMRRIDWSGLAKGAVIGQD